MSFCTFLYRRRENGAVRVQSGNGAAGGRWRVFHPFAVSSALELQHRYCYVTKLSRHLSTEHTTLVTVHAQMPSATELFLQGNLVFYERSSFEKYSNSDYATRE